MKQQLPLSQLNAFRLGLVFRSRGSLAKPDKRERIPLAALPVSKLRRLLSQFRKQNMPSNVPEPIPRIAAIALHAMHDGVPVHAIRMRGVVNQLVSFFETGKIEEQSAERGTRIARTWKKRRRIGLQQLQPYRFIRASRRKQLHRPRAATGCMRQQSRNFRAVNIRIETQYNQHT